LVETDMERIVHLIDEALMNHDNDTKLASIKGEVNNWVKDFPLFS